MDKKTLIGLGLSFATAGVAVIFILGFRAVNKMKAKRERKKLKKYVNKYLGGNEKALNVIGGLSNLEVHILFKVIQKTTEKLSEIKLPAAISDKISDLVEG